MPRVVIKRTSEYSNSLRDYKICIDGTVVGKISNGQTKIFETGPGNHKLIAKIDWASSPEIPFDIKEGEEKIFKVGAYKAGNVLVILAMVFVFSGFILRRTSFGQYSWLAGIPLLAIILYYITFGRKKYLTLTVE